MKKNIKTALLVLATIVYSCASIQLFAQDAGLRTISGKVTDPENNVLPGTIIVAFNSGDKSVTDAEGKYSIKISNTDHLSATKDGYEVNITASSKIFSDQENIIILEKKISIGENNAVVTPYRTMLRYQDNSALNTISGEELESFPSTSFIDALSGLLPGVYVKSNASTPGEENYTVTIRGEAAVVYIDGVIRDPSDLSAFEVDQVQVLKNLPGRAMLGIYGSSPVLWITTKTGESFNRQIRFSSEYGINAPTTLPEYTNAYDYATLFNEALVNDGYSEFYSAEALNAYSNNSDPIHYPNINYFNDYVKEASSFRKIDLSFQGGDENVNYFSNFNYSGSGGLEGMGETYNSDRLKLRGNVNLKINDMISMNVIISGTYRTGRNPLINIFPAIASLPSNAHPILMDSVYIVNSSYPTNIENSLLHGGFNETSYLGTQNSASINLDLTSFVEGLSAVATIAFDASGRLDNYKRESEALYRIISSSTGGDSIELVQPKVITPDLSVGTNNFMRKTVLYTALNYNRSLGEDNFFADLVYYQGSFVENAYVGYQPELMQDVALRTAYVFNKKYSVQLEQTFSGSMRLPEGKRMSYYPTLSIGWLLSSEDFLSNNENINFLKLNLSAGVVGLNYFSLAGYNSYHLYQTLWESQGSWGSGLMSKTGTANTIYVISQAGSEDYSLPKKNYANLGLQGSAFDNALSFDLNYFMTRYYDLISQKASQTPSLFGDGQFLPATNYGETRYSGIDGMLQYTKMIGDFRFSAGLNGLYRRGKFIVVDEPLQQDDYRKYTGKRTDEYVLYNALGLYQSQPEIDDRGVAQTFGALKPGDIIYEDYFEDGVVDEKDMYRTGAHMPRFFYGANVSLSYKGIGIKLVGQGVADGELLLNNSYFTSTGYMQNFTQPMMNRWPLSNDVPRLTTNSDNNVQASTFWLKNAAYFRLKNVQLSYTLPPKVSLGMGMRNATIFLRASNPITISGLSEYGVDPENEMAGIWSYPIYKTFSAGIKCNF